jgi:hypothetical protein
MDNNQNHKEEQKAAIETKLHQSGITESDLIKAGYFRSPWLDFLKTESGNKFGESVVNLINVMGQKYHTTHKWDTVSKVGCIIIIVIAASVLLYFGKFEPSVGVLFGTIIGYLYGKSNND